jgi:hypothetical protein
MLSIIIHRRHHTVTAMAGKLGTAARRVTRCRAATVRRIEVPAEADGVLGTAVPRATRCRAATVHPIKVRSAARRADGMAIEFKRTQAQRYYLVDYLADRVPCGNFAAKFRASDSVLMSLEQMLPSGRKFVRGIRRCIDNSNTHALRKISGIASHRYGSTARLHIASTSSVNVR